MSYLYKQFTTAKALPILVGILLALLSLGYAQFSDTSFDGAPADYPAGNPSLIESASFSETQSTEANADPALLVCGITLKPTVSGCYLVNNQSKATVSVEVAWTDAPANDSIKVTLGSQTRYIKPGTIKVDYGFQVGVQNQFIVSPQVVAFEVNANGSTGNAITAAFAGAASCSASGAYSAPASCALTACGGSNLGGVVFKDFDNDGIQGSGESVGVEGVKVKAVACDGTIYDTTTDGYGGYSLPVPAGKYPVRVEFSNMREDLVTGFKGADSRTSVQFVNAPDCGVDLGLASPSDFCVADSLALYVTCFTYGDPLVSGSSSANSDALVSIPYGLSSATFEGEKKIALASEIGTVWGLAYNKFKKTLFQRRGA